MACRFSSFLLMFIIFLSPLMLLAKKPEVQPCFGYDDGLCTLAKREHELGNMLRFSYSPKEKAPDGKPVGEYQENTYYSLGLSLISYQYNVNAYFSVRTEIGGSMIFKTEPLFSITGFDADWNLGIRAYPWKKWFYMGTGFILRGMYINNKELYAPFSGQFYSYMELGLNFPTRESTIDLNFKLRTDLLSAFGYNGLTSKYDPMAKVPIVFAFGYTGLFGKLGAVPADEAYDAFMAIRNKDAYMTFSNVFFDSEATLLNDDTKLHIRNILKLAKNYNPKIIIVRAYGDVQDKNIRKQQKTANSRAQNILEYLISEGVHKDKIVAVGVPVKKSTTQTLKERNQRAEIVLVR